MPSYQFDHVFSTRYKFPLEVQASNPTKRVLSYSLINTLVTIAPMGTFFLAGLHGTLQDTGSDH